MTTRVAIVGGTGKLGGIIREVVEDERRLRGRRDALVAVRARPSSTAPTWSSTPRPRPSRSTSCARRSSAASTSSSAPRAGRPSASRSCGRSSRPRAPAPCSSPTSRSARCSARRSPPPPRRSSRRSRSSRRTARRRSTRRAAPPFAPPSSSPPRAPRSGPVESPHVDQRARGQQVASVPIHSLRRPGVVARQETILVGCGRVAHDHPRHRRAGARPMPPASGSRSPPRATPAVSSSGSTASSTSASACRGRRRERARRGGRRARAGRPRHRRMSARIGVAVMAVLLALYIVLVGAARVAAADQRASRSAIAMGVALVVLPAHRGVGARPRAVVRRARRAARRGGSRPRAALPAEEVAVRPSGRVVREDADARLPALPGRRRGAPGGLAGLVPARPRLRRRRRPAACPRGGAAARSGSRPPSGAAEPQPAAGTAARDGLPRPSAWRNVKPDASSTVGTTSQRRW